MPGCNAPAVPMPPHRAASQNRAARRLPADGYRRPVTERCGHHPVCIPGAAQVAAHNGAPLWRTMMERWLAAAP